MNNLLISPAAQNTLTHQNAYCRLFVKSTGTLTLAKITKTIHIIKDYALIGAPVCIVTCINSDCRYLVIENLLVFYPVVDKDVFVDRILYSRRDYLQILFSGICKTG